MGEIWFQVPGDSTPDLLVKYLFTRDKLSVQVHPDDVAANARGLPRGKDECWLILDAEPDSTIAMGFLEPIDAGTARTAALDGSIEHLLDWKRVKAGDFLYAPAGTVHAIGAGITLIEIQQNSETTYRLFDYGRPRELHLDDGIAVADLMAWCPAPVPHQELGRTLLVEGPKFVVECWKGGDREIQLPNHMTAWLIPVRGQGEIDGTPWNAGECLTVRDGGTLRASSDSHLLFAYPGARRV